MIRDYMGKAEFDDEAREGTRVLAKEEFCRRFVEYMTREAGFEVFDNGQTVRAYAEETAPDYWDNSPDIPAEEAAEADMDCWED